MPSQASLEISCGAGLGCWWKVVMRGLYAASHFRSPCCVAKLRDALDEELFTFMASFGRYRGHWAQKQGDRWTIL